MHRSRVCSPIRLAAPSRRTPRPRVSTVGRRADRYPPTYSCISRRHQRGDEPTKGDLERVVAAPEEGERGRGSRGTGDGCLPASVSPGG
jgi:hypothetical protein